MFDYKFDIDGLFPADRTPCTPLEDKEHAKSELKTVTGRLIKFADDLEKRCNEHLEHTTKDNVFFKDTFATSFVTFTEAVKNEINEFEKNVDNTVTLFTSTTSETVRAEIVDMITKGEIDNIPVDFLTLKDSITGKYYKLSVVNTELVAVPVEV